MGEPERPLTEQELKALQQNLSRLSEPSVKEVRGPLFVSLAIACSISILTRGYLAPGLVARLFYLEEKSYEEVSAMLGLPLGTVKTYLHRARKQLAGRHHTSLFVRISFVVELAGLAAVAGAGALVVQHWFPRLLLGGPWVVAAAILCVGAWLTLADPPTPSA
jgi:hypothetical protein